METVPGGFRPVMNAWKMGGRIHAESLRLQASLSFQVRQLFGGGFGWAGETSRFIMAVSDLGNVCFPVVDGV
jgi:hypothetical protein